MKIRYPILYGRTRNEEFAVQSTLGVGGFSYVYKVVNNRGTCFATKIVKSEDAKEISSIRHEGNILSQIQGDNIIGLFYFHDGTVYTDLPPYLILEYAEDDLNNIIGKRCSHSRHFTIPQLLDMFRQICYGIRLINQTAVHCDINPTNILMIGNNLKIADFGLTELVGQPTDKSEFREYRNWEYVAPEYWEGTDSTPEVDIYCAGLIFYYAATLQYPYVVSKEGDDESACKEAHISQAAKNPCDWNGEISSTLSSLILKMIAKKPQDRFHSWDKIIAILNECPITNQHRLNTQ